MTTGPRPLIERIGIFLVAVIIAGLFLLVAGASWIGGEGFLAVMAGGGAAMTLWAGLHSAIRG